MFVPMVGCAAPLQCRLAASVAVLPLDANALARASSALSADGAYTRFTIVGGGALRVKSCASRA
ncbi:hypothetical protein CBA19CS22_39670 [Caballeronia novacaledonica]|uniref:Uncharacterized protein n=1 Tax=Caballeronia novacaledonica TaxID=1544861 RepID=A0ACB5R685_9BURK|nr:hypothetical protein CBA19CS22_39670 [Caballeronia novacaledonica]